MMLSVRMSNLMMIHQRHVRTASKWPFFFSLAMLMVPQALQNHAVAVAVLAVAGGVTRTRKTMTGLVAVPRKRAGSASLLLNSNVKPKIVRYG